MFDLDVFCATMVVDTLNELDNNDREKYDVDMLIDLVKKSIEIWGSNDDYHVKTLGVLNA